MKAIFSLLMVVVAFPGWGSSIGGVGPPLIINHQGIVKVNGEPFSGTGDFRFAFIDSESGDELWTNDGSSSSSLGFPNLGVPISVSKGLYSVILGEVTLPNMTAIPGEAFQSHNVVLRIWFSDGINGVQRLLPDHVMTSTPYSFRALSALDADTLDGLDSTDFLSQLGRDIQMLSRDFTVAAGRTVGVGDVVSFMGGSSEIGPGYTPAGPGPEIVFNASATLFGDAAKLTDNRFIIAFQDGGSERNSKIMVGEVEGDSMTFGSPRIFKSGGQSGRGEIAVLSPDRFVVAYEDDNNDNWGIVRVGQISGNDISFGNGAAFHTDHTTSVCIAPLSESRFVVAYVDFADSFIGKARIGDVQGTQISLSPEVPFHMGDTDALSIDTLTANRVVIAYIKGGSPPMGAGVIGNIAGNSLTFGPERIFEENDTDVVKCVAVSPDRFIIAYIGESSFDPEEFGGVISGQALDDAIAYGYLTIIRKPNFLFPDCTPLGLNRFALVIGRSTLDTDQNYGEWFVGGTESSQVEILADGFFNPERIQFPKAAGLTPTTFVAVYEDFGNSAFGTARLVRTEPGSLVGIARESGEGGETVPVTLFSRGAVSDTHEGLLPGAVYYGHPDGSVSTGMNGTRLGIAVTESEILLDP